MVRQSKVFVALCWKHLRVRRHTIFTTIAEFLIAIVLMGCLCLVYYAKKDGEKGNTWPGGFIYHPLIKSNITYYPENDFTKQLMENYKMLLPISEIKPTDSKESVDELVDENPLLMGLIFENASRKTLNYTLRTSELFKAEEFYIQDRGPYADRKKPGDYSAYIKYHLVRRQFVVNAAYAYTVVKAYDKMMINVSSFPISTGVNDARIFIFLSVKLSDFIIYGFLLVVICMVKRIVLEKEIGVQMLLGLMGARNRTLWLSWLLHALVMGIIISLIDALFLHFTMLKADCAVVFLTIVLFFVSLICYFFIFCAIITSPFLALLLVFVEWILACIIGSQIMSEESTHFVWIQVAIALVCPIFCMFYAIEYFVERDLTEPVSWSTIHDPHGSQLSLLGCWLIFILSAILYFILVLWLDPMFPGKYGNPQGCFWFIKKKKQNTAMLGPTVRGSVAHLSQELVEGPPPGAHVGIRTTNLRKVYTRKIFKKAYRSVAVKDMTLEIYRDNITVILGINGAGKTTTINLIAGVKMATRGKILVDGVAIARAQGMVSLCPGENVFIPSLTVREHLLLGAKIRGEPKKNFDNLVNTVTAQVGLERHLDKTPQQLSGGYKRRLCIAIALMGKTNIILLDEPTSGLDPEARRDVWDIVLQLRKGRTVLITTQFMEEADVLGDRVIIISEGDVLCYGTPPFLRKVYGTGYMLTIQKTKDAEVNQITAAVRKAVPAASRTTETKYTLMYSLPLNAVERFPQLFEDLENRRSGLGIITLGLSVSSIEDIFFKSNQYDPSSHTIPATIEGNCSHVKGANLLSQRLLILFDKEMLYLVRSWMSVLFSALFAIIAILAAQLLLLNIRKTVSPRRSLALDAVDGATVLVSGRPAPAMLRALKDVVNEANATLLEFKTFKDMQAAMEKAEKENPNVAHKYVMGLDFPAINESILYYGSWGVHFLPISVNVLSSTLMRQISAKEKKKAPQILMTVQPSSKPQKSFASQQLIMDLWILIIPLSLSMWLVIFMNLHVEEHMSGLKTLQVMSGVPTVIYWGCRYLVHLALHTMLVIVLTITLYYSEQIDLYNNEPEIVMFFLLLFMYGVAALPFAYLLSYVCTNLVTSYAAVITIFFCGLLYCLILIVTNESPQMDSVMKKVEYVMLFSPVYCLISAILHFQFTATKNRQCSAIFEESKKLICGAKPQFICCTCQNAEECKFINNYFDHTLIERFTFLFFTPILYFIVILLIDANFFEFMKAKFALMGYERREKQRKKDEAKGKVAKMMKVTAFAEKERRRRKADEAPLDSDVERERQRVISDFKVFKEADAQDHRLKVPSTANGNALIVCNLIKAYNSHQLVVRGMSFRVKAGECFGFLGLNGAGKSTTFNMLIGKHAPSKGDAVADFYSLCANRRKFAAQIGYCPQMDAYVRCFTGYEHIMLMSTLRGVQKSQIAEENMKWIVLLGMEKTVLERVNRYSAGERRKLNTVMAMVGEPPLVFLDEATSAVDAWSRRKLWDALSVIRKDNQQTVVITSHSMDECEALCDRLAIMCRGQNRCLGDVPHLKEKFRKGFTIRIKVSGNEKTLPNLIKDLKAEIVKVFPKIRIKDERPVFLEYRVDDPNLKWSFLFREMQKIRKKFNIVDDYTISETTLEEIFLSMGENV